MWSGPFEAIVRGQLTVRPADPLGADEPLADRGLDSMGTVSLLVELEDAYGVVFTDELLVPATFATAGALWCAVSSLAQPAVAER
jgi:acyl carrier protein